ncbi:nuclear protein [Rhizophlyctis rosea]|uniref:Non-structural maintenance of chromosomes element 4 n=1 Tax=Rhizophlyctis rosea TaxID=64517 RepID=A0AAD5WYB1_9FUNG|nr:nuclear protein [Rhizophlyctis rosea]
MPREEDEDATMDEVDGEEEGEEDVDDPANYFTQPTREEREHVRSQYRQLYEVEDGKDMASLTLAQLKERTSKANELLKHVNTTQEAALDHKTLVDISNAAAKRIKQMRIDGGTFDVDEYLNKVASKMRRQVPVDLDEDEEDVGGRNDLDWFALGRVAGKWLQRAPTMDFLLGPLAVDPKEKVQRQRRVRDKQDLHNMKNPTSISREEITQEGETTTLVVELTRKLHQAGRIPFFQFVINPHSFSQTVENIFYLSFMIRDGTASLEDDDGELVLEPQEAPAAHAYADGEVRRVQAIVDIDEAVWREAIEVYHIRESFLPHRAVAPDAHPNRWIPVATQQQ